VSKSQNGWPVAARDQQDEGTYAGVRFPNGILAGDVATIARWQLARYAAVVEPLVQGTCWGWFVKAIEGSTTISNHASGTAWDVNADQHPMGRPASANMSADQIRQCRALVTAADGVLRWGGDYTGRPDPMHWEIVGTRTEVAALAAKIKREAATVAITPTEINAIRDAILAAQITDYADAATPKRKISLATWVGYSDARRNSVLTAVADLRTHLDTRLDAIEASLAYLKSGLDTLTDEPTP
jgi:D-alanyl-D-alanine carboxypeptidase